ncbi:MAG TPA: type II secretion system F family protein, partial [Thermodesulfobacteriota bacterium]|nr:type II secretion system F family protein [Thermodesulfobacteriota bacterium]
MPVFVWEGRLGGAIKKGEMDAPSRSAVLARLRQMQIQPIPNRIREKGKLFGLNFSLGGVSTRDLVIFTRQLSTMIDAGLPLVRGLDIIASQHPNPKFKQIIIKVKEDVEAGSTFADSLAKHPKVFSNLYTQLIKAGETGGVLDVILQRLANYLEKMDSIKRKIKGAMIYPAIVISVAVMVLAIVIIFVVPVFAEMFKDMGTTLPGLTQLVVDISFFTRHNILYILIAIAAIFFLAGFAYNRSYKVRRLFDAFLLKLWLVGPLMLKTIIARFCRTLATLTAGGIAILDGLEITAKASGNIITEEAILEARKGVSEGQTLAEPLIARPKLFPPMVVQMISVGEQTGALEDMLNKIADFYEEE